MTHDLTALAEKLQQLYDKRELPTWGDIHDAASALRAAAVQGEPDQKPVALAHVRLEDDGLLADLEVLDGTNLQPSMSPVALYLSPPPAAGWDAAINAACNICREAVDPSNSSSHIAAAEEIREQIEALRHNAPPDSGAGKSEPELPPLTCDFAQAFPDGTIDNSTYSKIEDALDKIDAPCQGADGKWLSLHERIAAISKPAPVAANASAEAITEADIRAHVGDGMVSMQNVIDAANAILATRASAETRLREALEKIAGSHWERVGRCQTDVDDVPDLTAEEAMQEARKALSAHPHASGCDKQGERK